MVVKCCCCEEPVADDESLFEISGGLACYDCFDDQTFGCCRCGESSANENKTNLVVFEDGLSWVGGEAGTGVFKITGHYFSDGMIEYRLFNTGVERVADLPEGIEFEFPLGHFCPECFESAVSRVKQSA